MVSSKEYQGHPVFQDLDSFIDFYRFLSHQTWPFLSLGTKAALSLDSYVFSSIQGTLESVRTVLRAGMINDAYVLVRMYYDAAIINAYTAHYLKSHFSMEQLIVESIDGWRSGELKLPRFKVMATYLRQADSLVTLSKVLGTDQRYEQLRDRCNGHVHFNYYANMLLNIKEIHLDERANVLNQLRRDLRDILTLHLAYVFSINPAYMAPTDYVDALELGLQPEPGSEYWVAPFVQEIFDKHISPIRSDVAVVVKANSDMELRLPGE